jgi:hypothetical protein
LPKQIPLTRNKIAIVDDADYEWLNRWKWCCLANGYVMRRETTESHPGGSRSRYVYMHRQIMDAPEGHYVDHINHDTCDNRRENLRVATPTESMRNTRALRGGTSPFKGVGLARRRWVARIQIEGEQIGLGRFLTQREAAAAYNEAAILHFGEFACLNDLSQVAPEDDPPFQILDRRYATE